MKRGKRGVRMGREIEGGDLGRFAIEGSCGEVWYLCENTFHFAFTT